MPHPPSFGARSGEGIPSRRVHHLLFCSCRTCNYSSFKQSTNRAYNRRSSFTPSKEGMDLCQKGTASIHGHSELPDAALQLSVAGCLLWYVCQRYELLAPLCVGSQKQTCPRKRRKPGCEISDPNSRPASSSLAKTHGLGRSGWETSCWISEVPGQPLKPAERPDCGRWD